MRKLQFKAVSTLNSMTEERISQHVMSVLKPALIDYGFQTKLEESQLAVGVQDHPVALGVNCQSPDENGALVCEINAFADENQDWFQKIETQSMIKQLAHAVEETLKKDPNLQDFAWKNND